MTFGAPLLLASLAGTLGGLSLWAARGWRDGLACYVATILVIGAMLLWRTGWHPHHADIRGSAGAEAASTRPGDTQRASRLG